FYPYRESRTVVRRVKGKRVRRKVDIEFPDARTWAKYGKGKGFSSRDAWRRANIDDFVQSLYRGVKAIKPSVLVGIAPFGIWRSGTPEGVKGLDAYDEIYADSRRWLAEGWLDYIAPQLYWPLDGVEDRFRALDSWWRSENRLDRYVWPALYTSHVYGGRDPWPLGEIGDEIQVLRQSSAATSEPPGHVHFRLAALFADGDRLASTLADMYRDSAIVPAFPWLGATVPAAPLVTVDSADGAARFSVAAGDSVRVRWWLIQTRGRDGVWLTSLRPVGEGHIDAAAFGTAGPSEIAFTAIGLTGVASQATLIAP
ncbi:MAG: glycoside hydrolase family 10 protein, partial [Gemmatimonadaceae bacterium]